MLILPTLPYFVFMHFVSFETKKQKKKQTFDKNLKELQKN